MHVKKNVCCDNIPSWIGLPKGMVILFFGNTGSKYIIIYAKEEAMKTKAGKIALGLGDASIAVGTEGETMTIFPVTHGVLKNGVSTIYSRQLDEIKFGLQLGNLYALYRGQWMDEVYLIRGV